MDNDNWIKELAAVDSKNMAPRADIADRVVNELQKIDVAASRDWVSPILVALASVAAGLLVALAIPAWRDLSTPIASITEQFIVALDGSY